MRFSWSLSNSRLRLVSALVLGTALGLTAQPTPIVSVWTQLHRAQTDSARAQLYLNLGELYLQSNLDSARHCFRRSISFVQKHTNQRLLARNYLKLGYVDFCQTDFVGGLAALRKAEQIQQTFPADSSLLEIQVLLAVDRRSLGDYPGGLKTCLALLRAYEKNPILANRQLGMLYTELGIIYDHLGQYDLARQYHQQRLMLSKRGTNPRDLMIAYLNLGTFYEDSNELAAARTYYVQALALARRFQFRVDFISILTSIGDVAYKRQQFDTAIQYHKQAITRDLIKSGDADDINWVYMALAKDYQALHRYQTALIYVNKAIQLNQTTHSARNFQQALLVKSKLLAATGQYRAALTNLLKAEALADSLVGIDKQRAIAHVQASYDSERRQAQIVTLRKDLTIQKQAQHTTQLQLRLAQKQQLLYLTSALLLTLLLGISYVSIQRQRAAQRLLLAQKEEIQQQTLRLTEINHTKDKLFSLISHDLRSPVAQLKRDFSHLQTQKQVPASLRKSLDNLENQVDGILNLLTNLLDWSHSQLTGFRPTIQRMDLSQAVIDVTSQLTDQLRYKNIGLINDITEPVFVKADKHQLHSVLRNLLNNAVKFTPAGGFIRLTTKNSLHQVDLLIQDTGIGIATNELTHLLSNPTIRTGTQGELSMGLGLRLTQELLTKQGGSVTVSSQPGKGTTVRVRLVASTANEMAER